ncbi:MAG: DUF3365 domain-containing protein [Chitinophagaceae bacterium]|jgi:hypothetical protein|nr:DUF3365 domain-containing protein [Chitinophagaceae bacterium]
MKISIMLFPVLASILVSCGNNQPEADVNEDIAIDTAINYEETGLRFANNTQAVLGKNLVNAINEKAFPLTDSMTRVLKASIKRVSDKPRNINNLANSNESAHIQTFKESLAKGEQPEPVIMEINGKMVGHYAIITNKICLQCHGVLNKDILPQTLSKIKNLYPEDKATGYAENQVRGLWVVEMEKN